MVRGNRPPSGADRSDFRAEDRKHLIVNFHGIGEPWDGVPEGEQPYWCPPAEWPALADCLAELGERADLTVELTFDDGNVSDVDEALPALVERGLTATFFVCAGRLGAPRYLSVDHLHALRAAGMGIGSHGWDHRDLRKVPNAEMVREVSESRAYIGDAVGAEITSFAVPFGSYDRRVLSFLREYPTVLTSDRMAAPKTGWLIPRYSYMRGWGPQQVSQLASVRTNPANLWFRRAVVLYKRLR